MTRTSIIPNEDRTLRSTSFIGDAHSESDQNRTAVISYSHDNIYSVYPKTRFYGVDYTHKGGTFINYTETDYYLIAVDESVRYEYGSLQSTVAISIDLGMI